MYNAWFKIKFVYRFIFKINYQTSLKNIGANGPLWIERVNRFYFETIDGGVDVVM